MVRAKTTSRKSTGSTTKNTKKSTKSEPSTTEDFEAMKVTELKALCTERGLSTSGNKAELVKRLAKGAEKKTEKRKTTKKPAKESEEEVEEENQESEDEESEEEPPKKEKKSTKGKTTSKAPAKAKKSTKKVESEEDEPESSEEVVVAKKSSKGKPKKAPVESSDGSESEEPSEQESEEKPVRKSKKPSKVAPAKKSHSRKVESESEEEPEDEPEESESPVPKKSSKKATGKTSKKVPNKKARKVESESEESPAPVKKSSSKSSSKKSSKKARETSSESSESSEEEVAEVQYSKFATGLADTIRESGLAGEVEEGGPTLEDVIEAYLTLTKEHPEMIEEEQGDEVPEESAKDEEQVQEPASETKPSATQGPLKVSYDEDVQAFVSDGFVFDVESKTVFAKLADGEIAALEKDDIKALDKLRIRHMEADEDRIIELVENNRKIRQGQNAAPDAEGAPEGNDDGEENAIGDVENGMKEITENPAPPIDEAKFKSFVVAQREQSNKTDFLAIAKASKLTEAEAQHIMLSYKTYADKYPQVISEAAVRTVKTAIGTKNDTRPGAKPVRKFIRK